MRACVTKPFARDSYWSAHPRSANTRSLFVQDTSYPFHWSIVFPISSILPDMILPYLRHRQMAKNTTYNLRMSRRYWIGRPDNWTVSSRMPSNIQLLAKSYGPSHQTLTNNAPYNRIYIYTHENIGVVVSSDLCITEQLREFLDDKICIKLPMTAMSVLK